MRASGSRIGSRFLFAPGRGSPGPRRIVTIVGLIALLLPFARIAAAEEEGGAIPVGGFRMLEPIQDSLGGSSWVMASGMDPRLAPIPTSHAGFRATDWTGYAAAGGGGSGGGSGAAYAPLVPARSAAPAFSRNQIITRQVGLFPIQTEPHLAVDPNDPEHLVLGTIDYNFPSMSSYVSFDGGETWDGPNQIRYFQEDFGAAGDPVVAFGRDGSIYLASISLGFEEFVLGGLVSFTEISSMVVSKSTDGGLTWSDAVSAARSVVTTASSPDPEDGRERGTITAEFLDKPWMAVGPDPDDPDKDIIHLSYTEFATTLRTLYADELPFLTSPATNTTIRSVHSEDGGATWSEPVAVSPTVLQAEGSSEPGEEREGAGEGGVQTQNDDGEGGGNQTQEEDGVSGEANQTVQGSQPAVLSDGTLAVTYLDTTNDGVQEGLATIMLALSDDAGETFGDPIQAGVVKELHFSPRSSTFRYWGAAFPQIAVGPADEIYVAAAAMPADRPTDDGDIFLFRTMDRGETWEETVRLNQDDTSRLQFFPSIDVSPDGTLHAMWGDMRDDPDEARYHIYYTRSGDQGATFGFEIPEQGLRVPDTRVTDFPSNSLRGFPGGRFIGDYFSISAADEDVYMVWADTRLGEFGGPNQQIGFARQTAIAPPELFMNPASGPAGRDVTIQGFNFQPNSNVALDVGGIPATNLRTDDDGGFTTQIYMPVAGRGPRNVNAFDETGNFASASFFTDFGFDTIQESIEALQVQLAQGTGAPPAAVADDATPAASAAPLPSPPGNADGGSALPSAPGSDDEDDEAGAAPARVAAAGGGVPFTGGWAALAVGAVAYAGLAWHRRRRA